MSGAIPLLRLHTFMVWAEKTLLLAVVVVVEELRICNCRFPNSGQLLGQLSNCQFLKKCRFSVRQ
jgi:hypothetical protein